MAVFVERNNGSRCTLVNDVILVMKGDNFVCIRKHGRCILMQNDEGCVLNVLGDGCIVIFVKSNLYMSNCTVR